MTAKRPILKLKISLVGSSPPIWRRVLVPNWNTLAELHSIIQGSFGWGDDHLHCFRQGKRTFEAADPWSTSEPSEEDGVLLKSVLPRKGSTLDYLYDFGDSWDHRIVVEELLPVDPGRSYPTCVDGGRARPPEDVGGILRFNDIVDALGSAPGDAAGAGGGLDPELAEWLGEGFDPARFDLAEINRRIR